MPVECSSVFRQLNKAKEYARVNQMQINYKKTKLMVFNPCTSIDFMPEFTLNGHELEVVDEIRLLGIIIRSDMKWTSNTDDMVTKANKRLWMLRRLKSLGADIDDLIDVYIKQIRSVLELAVPAWQGGISQAERIELERVQKSAFHIVLGDEYISNKNALKSLNMENLKARREKLCLKFGKKAEKHEKHRKWFKRDDHPVNTRKEKLKYCGVKARLTRFKKSPLNFLTDRLNAHYSKTKK
jgi:hypothetical protein